MGPRIRLDSCRSFGTAAVHRQSVAAGMPCLLPATNEGLRTDGHTLSMDGTEIAVLKEVDYEVLCGLHTHVFGCTAIKHGSVLCLQHLLHGQQALCSPSEGLWRQFICDLSHLLALKGWQLRCCECSACPQGTHQPCKGQLAQQQLCAALVLPDLPQGDCARPEAMWLACARARCVHKHSVKDTRASSHSCYMQQVWWNRCASACSKQAASHSASWQLCDTSMCKQPQLTSCTSVPQLTHCRQV